MSSGGQNTTKIDYSSSLYLHPSDAHNPFTVEQLQGSNNYRCWRRTFSICLATRRKLGFVTGGEKRDESDKVKQEAWDLCNSMVMSWILGSVSESIRKSVMFMSTAEAIWRHLEARFCISNGARKSQLSKMLFEKKQSNRPI